MDIRLVPQEEIDKTKWNSCVHYAPNGNIFGYKWYLDNVAKDWDGLVEGDYESVFPLIHRQQSKGWWGRKIPVLHQPELIRTAGLYSIHVLSEKRIRSFLNAIPERYHQQDITLGEGTKPPSDIDYRVSEQYNYMLLLQEPYENLAAPYHPNLQQEIEKAHLAQLVPRNDLRPESLADFYRQHGSGSASDREIRSHALLRVMYNALHRGWGFASGVSNRRQELLAINFFLFSHKRVVSLMPVQSEAGAKVGALAYLFDMLMRTQAEKPLLLDFNLRQKSPFAESFGALQLPYFHLEKR
ncbi:MAG: hypothetical protein AAFR05_04705 [Bacteroidota bacterium]